MTTLQIFGIWAAIVVVFFVLTIGKSIPAPLAIAAIVGPALGLALGAAMHRRGWF